MAGFWGRIMGATQGAIDGWRAAGETQQIGQELNDHYEALWSLYDGSAFLQLAGDRKGVFKDQRVYRNTRLLFSHPPAVGDFYAAHVYLGNLPTDGKRLPDGSRGAIPIDPQTGDDTANEQLLKAIAENWGRWNWQEGMSIRPLYGSILGDGLTELIPDHARRTVWPQWVWPGYVTDFTIDQVGNLKGYTIEYMVHLVKDGKEETFLYRKQVTKDFYRFWKNGTPWSDLSETGHGEAEQENPYGFVPAVWDRHKRTRGSRGLSAIANTRQALYELNSTFSHGMDYQRKAFGAPVLVKGGMGTATEQVVGPPRTANPAALAESMTFKEVASDGGIEILQFDISSALETLDWIKTGILEANPEANFYNQLRQMTQLTGPAVERALGDAVARVTMARAGYDIGSVKLFQMSIAMEGQAIRDGLWTDMTERDKVFAPFGLDSYKAGQLDMVILGRPVVPETQRERVERVVLQESLQTPWGLMQTGVDETVANQVVAEKRERYAATVNAGLYGQDYSEEGA